MAGAARKIMIGQVTGTKMMRIAKVRIRNLVLDTYVTQYFPKNSTVFAYDPNQEAKLGDIVLVKELPVKKAKNVNYQMDRVIYSLGNVTDPISGRKCDGWSYWDENQSEDRTSDKDATDNKETQIN